MLFCVVELFTHLECHSHLHLQSTRDIAPLIWALYRGFHHFKMPSGQVSAERELVKCKLINVIWHGSCSLSPTLGLALVCTRNAECLDRCAASSPTWSCGGLKQVLGWGFRYLAPCCMWQEHICIRWTVAGIDPDLKATKGISSMALSNCIFAFITIDMGFLPF